MIGTGSSGVQVHTPWWPQEAAELVVFQRTANFTLPARNAPLDRDKVEYFRAHRAELRARERASRNGTLRKNYDESAVTAPAELREERFGQWWEIGGSDIIGTFNDLTVDQRANDLLADFIRGKVREIVRDPRAAAALTSQDYPVGAKRVCLGTDYYELGMVGKSERGEEAVKAIRDHKAVYLMAVGGAAYLVSEGDQEVARGGLPRSGHGSHLRVSEAPHDMPVTVAVDVDGNSVHDDRPARVEAEDRRTGGDFVSSN